MGSTRLPGKVMMELAGKPLIWHINDRLRRTPGLDDVVLATTHDPRNDAMVRYAYDLGMTVYRAEAENDIARRLVGAAHCVGAQAILKVNGDCPLVDPGVMAVMVDRFARASLIDYVSNKIVWTYPLGLSAEVISSEALEWCDANLTTEQDRELVSDWIRDHPDRFRVLSVEGAQDLSPHNWMIDEPSDFQFVSSIFDALYTAEGTFGMVEVLEFLDKAGHPAEILPTLQDAT